MVTARLAQRLAITVVVIAAVTGCDGEADPPDADSSDVERSTPVPEPVGDLDDLKGQWRLLEAEIGGEQFSPVRGAGVELTVHTRSSQAFVGCDFIGLRPRVDTAEVSLRPLAEFGSMLSCPPFYEESPLTSSRYFDALRAVDRGERDMRTLVLTGPDLVLTFQKHR